MNGDLLSGIAWNALRNVCISVQCTTISGDSDRTVFGSLNESLAIC